MKNHFLRAFILLSVCSSAQPDFSNAFFNKMNMNPAYTGLQDITAPDTNMRGHANIIYNTMSQNYQNLMCSVQTPLSPHSGFGAMVNYNHNDYDFSQYAVKLFYRYTIVPGLYIGASGGIVDIDFGNAPYTSSSFVAPDFDLGILGQTGSVFFGLAFGHINSPGYAYTASGYENNMPYYTGITFNSMFGCNLNISETRLCMMACFYNNDLSAHLLFYPCKYFFIGLSSTVYYDGAHEVPLISQDIKRDDYSIAFTAGLSLLNNQLNISLSIIKYPGLYNGNYPNSESLLGYGF